MPALVRDDLAQDDHAIWGFARARLVVELGDVFAAEVLIVAELLMIWFVVRSMLAITKPSILYGKAEREGGG